MTDNDEYFIMNEKEEKFLYFYMEQTWEEMRHIENLREKLTILIVTLATAIVGFVMQQKFALSTKPLIWFIIGLGIFGVVMVLKLYQIHKMDQQRLDEWYKYCAESTGGESKVLVLRDRADQKNKKAFRYVSKIKHNYFWAAIHLFVFGGGIYLLTLYPSQVPVIVKPSKTKVEKVLVETENRLSKSGKAIANYRHL